MTQAYIDKLLRAYPQISAVWLIGSRADGSAKKSSDWDYIAFADCETWAKLGIDRQFNVPGIDLMIVYDGDNFAKPWPDGSKEKHGSLSGWCWAVMSDSTAIYRATTQRAGDNFYVDVKQAVAVRKA